MSQTAPSASIPTAVTAKKAKPWQRLLPVLITIGCFAYLYNRLSHAAAAEGTSLLAYLLKSFENVSWGYWLAMIISLCFLYFFLESPAVWGLIKLFNPKNP